MKLTQLCTCGHPRRSHISEYLSYRCRELRCRCMTFTPKGKESAEAKGSPEPTPNKPQGTRAAMPNRDACQSAPLQPSEDKMSKKYVEKHIQTEAIQFAISKLKEALEFRGNGVCYDAVFDMIKELEAGEANRTDARHIGAQNGEIKRATTRPTSRSCAPLKPSEDAFEKWCNEKIAQNQRLRDEAAADYESPVGKQIGMMRNEFLKSWAGYQGRMQAYEDALVQYRLTRQPDIDEEKLAELFESPALLEWVKACECLNYEAEDYIKAIRSGIEMLVQKSKKGD